MPLTPIEERYVMMFQMWKHHHLWPWQWGFADEPYFEQIIALQVMEGQYEKAQQFHNKQKSSQSQQHRPSQQQHQPDMRDMADKYSWQDNLTP